MLRYPTLSLPVEQALIDRIILIQRGWREIFVRFVQCNEEDIGLFIGKIFHAFAKGWRLLGIPVAEGGEHLVDGVHTVDIQWTSVRERIAFIHKSQMSQVIFENIHKLGPECFAGQDACNPFLDAA